jgi:hypothetical protein
MNQDGRELRGGCLCGAVRFRAKGPFRPVAYCHCKQCRVSHSHFVAYTAVPRASLSFETDEGLRWYRSSDEAQRGFCGTCGSRLFWNGEGRDYMSIAAGCLDEPTGLDATEHIFVRDKGDFYEITDGLPQHETGRGSPLRTAG